MNREKVQFAPNLPTIIELEGPGTLQQSANGAEEYRYFLQDERITWVPPAVHAQIVASGADHPGATFRVTKHQAKARAPITWEVERVSTARGNGYSSAPAPQAPPVDHFERTPGQGWTARTAPQQQPAQAQQRQQPQPAAQLAHDAPEFPTTPADRMAAALRDAIDLIRGAAHYEPSIAWTSSDVRAIAATLFIGVERGGRA
jgi:hypothetical protein